MTVQNKYDKIIIAFRSGGVAQWLEQMIHNHRVKGSSPFAATSFFKYTLYYFFPYASVAQSVERRIRNAQVEGSSPSAGSKGSKVYEKEGAGDPKFEGPRIFEKRSWNYGKDRIYRCGGYIR